jgi:hypothetical protein
MKSALTFAAIGETFAGLALLTTPSLDSQLLLGEQLASAGVPMARIAGMALIGLGIACWPGPPLVGMLIYSTLVTLFVACLGFSGGLIGVLLWPVIALHVILTAFLIREFMRKARGQGLLTTGDR